MAVPPVSIAAMQATSRRIGAPEQEVTDGLAQRRNLLAAGQELVSADLTGFDVDVSDVLQSPPDVLDLRQDIAMTGPSSLHPGRAAVADEKVQVRAADLRHLQLDVEEPGAFRSGCGGPTDRGSEERFLRGRSAFRHFLVSLLPFPPSPIVGLLSKSFAPLRFLL